ncbi:ParB/Srx family N-terminal domain-containing protein [Vibrio sp. ZSDE26]|uniref:ParB/Srx family N-terminal domain-containing protein n=1 Tax=Vibrio amylolyticus TaxID=2847292 RepID=A0A9X1XL35_9VIBR|nr:ParB/Srx family N-terminal domain-containing protein [Vibrio amylolyticus]MCK6264416.1 ParB/Srx family N-terminal domain-containing protein [Vibrio amylolyticus]
MLNTTKTVFIGGFFLIAPTAFASNIAQGDVIQVQLNEVIPTQPSVGYDQVFYKLGRFEQDKKKLFDEICEANGQRGLASFDKETSNAHDASSFVCKETVGERKKDMKTIVIAPNGDYYLTDGHHTFNVFWTMEEGGEDFPVHVVVEKDYRNLNNMAAFWDAMIEDGNTWLFNSEGKQITPAHLPMSLGLKNFENDQYRSLMYFSRDVGWNKPKQPVPFLEFYWSKEVRQAINLNNYDLTSKPGYSKAITDVSQFLLSLESDNVGGSDKSAKEMGQFDAFNQKGLDKLLREGKGKVSYSLQYKVAQTQ